jgi:DNA-binding transcriptional regulator YdaS (Cro superfamily)
MPLARYLVLHGLSQAKFADAVGVTQVCVNRWVNRGTMPRPHHLTAIEHATRGAVSAKDSRRPLKLE